MPYHKRPLWPLLTAALIGLPVFYVLSLGPLDWLIRQEVLPQPVADGLHFFASPVVWSYHRGPKWWHDFLDAYLALWHP